MTTQRPNFHHITGTQPVGHTQIAVAGEYAGTITQVKRCNDFYWSVTVRPVAGAFSNPQAGSSVQVCLDAKTGEYVAEYWSRPYHVEDHVEAGRAGTLRAALGIAIGTAAQRGHERGLW